MMAVAQVALIAAGLILPGWGWARRWGEGVLVAMVVSWVSIFGWTVLAAVGSVPLSGTYLLGGQAVVGAVGWAMARRAGVTDWRPKWDLQLGVGWGVLPLVVVAVWKAVAQPLSGVDADFRWDHLARMMVSHEGLGFYPPQTAEDFGVYFWADGIPPLISSLYAWAYLVAGETHRGWTAIPVLGQWLAVLILVRKLGVLWGGGRAGGNWALLIAGATFLLQFAGNLGQETSSTAIGAGVMLYGILRREAKGARSGSWIAGLGAALVASAREYGIAIALTGLVVHAIAVRRAGRGWSDLRGWLLLVLPAGWLLRTWIRSGNPWLSLSMGGVFPVNPIFHEWISGYRALYGESLATVAGWQEIGRLTLLAAAPAVAGWWAGLVMLRKQGGWLAGVAVSGATLVCWLLSVSYTAGGVFYAMRVLSPLLLLGCAWGGAVLARHLSSGGLRLAAAAGLGLIGIDASARALTATANPWTTPVAQWPSVGYAWQQEFWREQEPFFDTVIATIPGRFVGDAAGLQRLFAAEGRDYVPWWSPEVREMFLAEPAGDPIEVLRSRGITHMVFHRTAFTQQFLERTGVLARLDGRIRGVLANDQFVVFELLPAH